MKRIKRLLSRPKTPKTPNEPPKRDSDPAPGQSSVVEQPAPAVANACTTTKAQRGEKVGREFKYAPLKSPRNFRILHLQRKLSESQTGYRDLTLQGTIVEASLDSPPEYFALSYTWGDPVMSESIYIDGKVLKITPNCASALRRMLRGKPDRMIWVDSICINQASDADAIVERNKQVAMMDSIYKSAVQVNVYLGEGDQASDVACKALKDLAQTYLVAKMPGPNQEAGRIEYEKLADDVLKTTDEFPYGKLYGVFRLPWFGRAWTVQEVALGQKVFFYCGDHLMHFWTMIVGADFTRLPYSKMSIEANHWRAYLEYHHSLQEFIRRKDEGESLPNLRLSQLLLFPALQLQATKPEDKVFAFYGICRQLGFQLPEPDYRKPTAVVFTEAARAILRDDKSFDMLSSIDGSAGLSSGLPSWVPDFSASIRSFSSSNPPHMLPGTRTDARISGGSECHFQFEPDGRGLKIKGRKVDRICAIGEPWIIDSSSNLLGQAGKPTGQYIRGLLDCIESWFDVVKSRSDFPQGQRVPELLARVLTANRDTSGIQSEPAIELVRRLSILLNYAVAKDGPVLLVDPHDSSLDILKVGNYIISAGIRQAIVQIGKFSTWRRFLRTTRDYLGTGTHSARLGDVVAVFHGSDFPCIVRPCTGGTYRYVGPAYVDGIMEGQVWNSGAWDDEWFTLV